MSESIFRPVHLRQVNFPDLPDPDSSDISRCHFTRSALKNGMDSLTRRFNISIDTRPKLRFGDKNNYKTVADFDGIGGVPHIIHQMYHEGVLSVIYKV